MERSPWVDLDIRHGIRLEGDILDRSLLLDHNPLAQILPGREEVLPYALRHDHRESCPVSWFAWVQPMIISVEQEKRVSGMQ